MAAWRGMMRGSAFLLLALLSVATPLGAEPLEQELKQQLQAQGYEQIQSSRTWLGRLRLQARSGNLMREIVVNPNTGEILRDYAYRVPQSRSGEGGAAREAATTTADDQTDTGDEGPVDKAGDGGAVDVPDLIDPKDIAGDKTSKRQGAAKR